MPQVWALHSPSITVLALLRREIWSLVTGSPKFPHNTPHQANKWSALAAVTHSAHVPDPCRMRAMVCFQAEAPLTSLGFMWIWLCPDRKDFTTKETMALVNTPTRHMQHSSTSFGWNFRKSKLCPWKPQGWHFWGRFWARDATLPMPHKKTDFWALLPCFIPARQLPFHGAGCPQLRRGSEMQCFSFSSIFS